MKVLVNTPLDAHDWAVVARCWPTACEVVVRGEVGAEAVNAQAAEFEVVVGRADLAFLRAATGLRLIHVLGHGVDWLEAEGPAALVAERGIAIARANSAGIPVAEYVIGSMIVLSRRLMSVHHALAIHGDWQKPAAHANRGRAEFGGELYGSTAVIAGLGEIGQAIAVRAAALGMRTVALTRNPGAYPVVKGGPDVVASLADADEWLGRADYVVVVLPLTEDTRQFFDASRLAAMKPGCYLINVSRGEVVDYDALADSLASFHLAGAALDVWPDEDPSTYPSRRPIHQYNVIMTPHCSALTPRARDRSLEAIGENLHRWLASAPLRNQVR
jgi:phosphoglycerate dehydrogenase-like enzyme